MKWIAFVAIMALVVLLNTYNPLEVIGILVVSVGVAMLVLAAYLFVRVKIALWD